MTDRIPIPHDLAAKVMFASDQTCCVCRVSKMQIQIHHIDSDPSNNSFENLAVICLNCHSEAHSRQAFARNLTADLVRLYNDSWRELVKRRLTPSSEPVGLAEYSSEVFLDLSLDCHAWKNAYINLYPGHFMAEERIRTYIDVWDMMKDVATHKYSAVEWKRYLPLIIDETNRLCMSLDRALTLYYEIFPVAFKTLLIRTQRRLRWTQRHFSLLPQILSEVANLQTSNGEGSIDSVFRSQFTEATKAIGDVAREADRLRKVATGNS